MVRTPYWASPPLRSDSRGRDQSLRAKVRVNNYVSPRLHEGLARPDALARCGVAPEGLPVDTPPQVGGSGAECLQSKDTCLLSRGDAGNLGPRPGGPWTKQMSVCTRSPYSLLSHVRTDVVSTLRSHRPAPATVPGMGETCSALAGRVPSTGPWAPGGSGGHLVPCARRVRPADLTHVTHTRAPPPPRPALRHVTQGVVPLSHHLEPQRARPGPGPDEPAVKDSQGRTEETRLSSAVS